MSKTEMLVRPRRLYFDTNAASSLVEPRQGRTLEDLARIRTLLEQHRLLGRAEPVLSCTFFEEFALTAGRGLADYWSRLQLLRRIFRHSILWPVDELIQREARVGGPLGTQERYLDGVTSQKLWISAAHPDALQEVTPTIREGRTAYLERAKRHRNRARDEFVEAARRDGATKQRLQREFAASVAAWGRLRLVAEIDHWARDTLDALVARKWLPPTAATLPTGALPSLRHGAAYTMALMVMNLSGQVRVTQSDGHDVRHYAEAHYCDLMVSDDSNFVRTASLLGEGLDVISFNELERQLQAWLIGPVVTLPAPETPRCPP